MLFSLAVIVREFRVCMNSIVFSVFYEKEIVNVINNKYEVRWAVGDMQAVVHSGVRGVRRAHLQLMDPKRDTEILLGSRFGLYLFIYNL